MTFEVTETAIQGFVRVDATDARFLRFDRGAPYVPLGHNAGFEDGNPALNGTAYYDALFSGSFAAQENWTRIWMTDFNRSALEWGARALVRPLRGGRRSTRCHRRGGSTRSWRSPRSTACSSSWF